MLKSKATGKILFIAAATLAVIILSFTINHAREKENERNARYASLSPKDGVIEIKEKMFIAQVNEIYLNAEDYLGKTIKLEGVFKQTAYEEGQDPYYFVLRYGPGCCGYDGNVGFEVAWDKEKAESYPAADSWVEAEGVLKYYEESGYKLSYIDLASLNVLSKRGAETVLQ